MNERVLVLIKPDAMRRKIMGEIISMYERKGLNISRIDILTPNEKIISAHYQDYLEKPFFPELLDFMTSGPVCAMVIEGENSIAKVRKINGSTDPLQAEMGSIRAKYAESKSINCVHASDSVENAEKEISIWFSK